MTREALAKIGEIEASLPVEYQVVWRRQRVAVDLLVEQLGSAGVRIDALYVAELVVRVGPKTHRVAVGVATAAIVAEIEAPVGADRQSIRPAAALGERADLAVRCRARAALIADFCQHHRDIGQG